MFVQQQKDYQKLSMDDLVDSEQICHGIDQPVCKQCLCEAVRKHAQVEANQEMGATD